MFYFKKNECLLIILNHLHFQSSSQVLLVTNDSRLKTKKQTLVNAVFAIWSSLNDREQWVLVGSSCLLSCESSWSKQMILRAYQLSFDIHNKQFEIIVVAQLICQDSYKTQEKIIQNLVNYHRELAKLMMILTFWSDARCFTMPLTFPCFSSIERLFQVSQKICL